MAGKTDGERLVALETQLGTIINRLDELVRDGRQASESRKKQYEAQEAMARQMIVVDARLSRLEDDFSELRPTSKEIERWHQRAIGAGTLGKVLWKIGGILLGAVAGAASVWTYLTGRPPP